MQEHDSIARVQTLVGQCLNSLGKKEDARLAFEEAVAEIEHVRGQLAGGAEEAESFLADRIAPYQELVALFANDHRTEDALELLSAPVRAHSSTFWRKEKQRRRQMPTNRFADWSSVSPKQIAS